MNKSTLPRNSGGIPSVSTRFSLEYGDEQAADVGRDCRTRLARPTSQARTRTGKFSFLCSADHVQDWQPYLVDPYSCYTCDHTSTKHPCFDIADFKLFAKHYVQFD